MHFRNYCFFCKSFNQNNFFKLISTNYIDFKNKLLLILIELVIIENAKFYSNIQSTYTENNY